MYFIFGAFADKISGVVYNDLTGNFSFMSINGSAFFFILYHYEINAILVKAIANVDGHSIYAAYKEKFKMLEAKEYKSKMNIMDNQANKSSKVSHQKEMQFVDGGTTQSPCERGRASNTNIF